MKKRWITATRPVCAFPQGREVIHEDLFRHFCLTELYHCVWRTQHCPALTNTQQTERKCLKVNTSFESYWKESLMFHWSNSYYLWRDRKELWYTQISEVWGRTKLDSQRKICITLISTHSVIMYYNQVALGQKPFFIGMFLWLVWIIAKS